ncbi:MAG: Acetyl xylan esterase [Verrucomicrobia bacterium]|nr:Acetyl xylan esterase [Verrucomicrobiota bacterium]
MNAAPWEDLTPVSAAVEVRILSEEWVGDVQIFRLRFVSHEVEGSPLWVYGILGRKFGAENLPGLLHIHGGLQTASLRNVVHFAARGYAVLSFDWSGPTPERTKEITTVFPDFIPSIDDRTCPLSRARIRHIVHMARRGLTLLAARPEVDASRLGVYGISWGGFATWLVNGLDERVRAAVPVFGCEVNPSNPATESAWLGAFQPRQFAATQRGPVCYLTATNDFAGHWKDIRAWFDLVPVERIISLSANENHGIWESSSRTAWAWLDHFLKGGPAVPAPPALAVRFERGRAVVEWEGNQGGDAAVYFSYGTHQRRPGGYWRRASADAAGRASITLPSKVVQVEVFGHHPRPDGSAVSNFPVTIDVPPHAMRSSDEFPSRRLFDPADGIDGWFSEWRWHSTEILPLAGELVISDSASGERALKFVPANIRLVGEVTFDLMLRSPACALLDRASVSALALEASAPNGGTCELVVSNSGDDGLFEAGQCWSASATLQPLLEKQRLSFSAAMFNAVDPGKESVAFTFPELSLLRVRLSAPRRAPPAIHLIELT